MIPLLPEKHIRLNETALGLGAFVVQQLDEAMTLDQLWEALKELKKRKKSFPERIDFEDLIITIDILYALKAIDMDNEGALVKCA